MCEWWAECTSRLRYSKVSKVSKVFELCLSSPQSRNFFILYIVTQTVVLHYEISHSVGRFYTQIHSESTIFYHFLPYITIGPAAAELDLLLVIRWAHCVYYTRTLVWVCIASWLLELVQVCDQLELLLVYSIGLALLCALTLLVYDHTLLLV